jgi:uncharacterized alkaline shock family protein YloU
MTNGAGDAVSGVGEAVPAAGSESGSGPDAGSEAENGGGTAGRGATRIADLVVARVAVQAAREALRGGPHADRMPRGGAYSPHASVTVHDRVARVRIALELGYPSDIGAQCAAVRRQVTLRVRELVGMDVPEVAVGVERLHSEELGGGRVL